MDADTQIHIILPCSHQNLARAIQMDGEQHVATAITGSGERFLIFTDPKTHTFTVTLEFPNKMQCLVAVGTDFEQVISGVGL